MQWLMFHALSTSSVLRSATSSSVFIFARLNTQCAVRREVDLKYIRKQDCVNTVLLEAARFDRKPGVYCLLDTACPDRPWDGGRRSRVEVLRSLARDDLMGGVAISPQLANWHRPRPSMVERSGGQGFPGPNPHRASTGGGVALLAWRVCGELLQHLLLEGRLGGLDKGKPLEQFYVFQWRWRTGSTRTVS